MKSNKVTDKERFASSRIGRRTGHTCKSPHFSANPSRLIPALTAKDGEEEVAEPRPKIAGEGLLADETKPCSSLPD